MLHDNARTVHAHYIKQGTTRAIFPCIKCMKHKYRGTRVCMKSLAYLKCRDPRGERNGPYILGWVGHVSLSNMPVHRVPLSSRNECPIITRGFPDFPFRGNVGNFRDFLSSQNASRFYPRFSLK